MSRLALLLLRLLAPLPLPIIRGLGWVLGGLLYLLAPRRRRIAQTNLRLCFPQWSSAQRQRVLRRSFVVFAQALLDRAWIWHGAPELVRRRLHLRGQVEDLTRPGAVVMFAPHFYGMDAGGSAVMQQVNRPACTIYARQSNPVLDAWMQAGRSRFGQASLLARHEGVRPVIRSLREGKMLYLLPDMDLGEHDSVFVPFFGITAATVPSLSRFARLGKARVVPVVTRMTPQGYDVNVHAAWRDYPTADAAADTARMNAELEAWIERMPEQYYWVHRRFKTRPQGEAPVY